MKGIKGIVLSHIKSNLIIFAVVVLTIVFGIVAGSLSVHALNVEQKEGLVNYLNLFLNKPVTAEINTQSLLRQSLWNNIKSAGIMWVLGVTILGIPVVIVLLFFKGFVLGFTVGFLVEQLGFKGTLFSTASLLPQNIILLPVLVAMGMASISFSLMLISRRKTWSKVTLFQHFLGYTLCYGFYVLIMFSGVLIETYVTPVFIKSIISYME
jgi:stage II sporulation protein M